MIPALLLSTLGLLLFRTAFSDNPDPRVVLADLLGGGSVIPASTEGAAAQAEIEDRLLDLRQATLDRVQAIQAARAQSAGATIRPARSRAVAE